MGVSFIRIHASLKGSHQGTRRTVEGMVSQFGFGGHNFLRSSTGAERVRAWCLRHPPTQARL